MDKVIYRVIYNRKKKLNAEGTALVQVEAYLNKRKKYFSTNIYIKPGQWDDKKKVIKSHPNKKELNLFIHAFIIDLEWKELKAWKEGKSFLLNELDSKIKQPQKISFLEFYQKESTTVSIKESTQKNHLSTLSLLHSYKKEIFFEDLSYEFLCDFERFLLSKGQCRNTIAKHLRHIKRYVNIAINKNLLDLDKYPFRKYKIRYSDSTRIHLTPEELSSLEQLDLSGQSIITERCLNAFLFSCYTGLRYSDIIRIKYENIVSIDNKIWLVFLSTKTGIETRIPLSLLFQGKALGIIEQSRGSSPFLFHIPDNSNVNKQLSKIRLLAGIKKKISFHTGRHTNATLLLYNGADITTVKKILGHKSLQTTQIYCNIMDMTVVRDLENINKAKP